MLIPDIGTSGGRRERKKYLPAERTVLKLLVYMVENESRGPFSVYRLMRFEPRRLQRRDRVHLMLGQLVDRGWVEASPDSPARYQASEEGKRQYCQIKNILDILENWSRKGEGELC